MPIRPENLASYPGGSIRSKEWLAIRAFIRARAGDRCEGCGVKNGEVGIRLRQGEFFPCVDQSTKPGTKLLRAKVIRIVCTVAHVDRSLVNHHTSNLAFWCQQCHNRHDAADRAAGVKARKATSDAL